MTLQHLTSLPLTSAEPRRQSRALAWLREHDLTQADLAARLGVSVQYISQILRGERAPEQRLLQLREIGFPAELLPDPRPDGRCRSGRRKAGAARPETEARQVSEGTHDV